MKILSILVIILMVFYFAPLISAQGQECGITYSFLRENKNYNIYRINLFFNNNDYLRKPLLLYCDSEGSYPRPFMCIDKNNCYATCVYGSKGEYEVKVVERPSRIGSSCVELCSKRITIGEVTKEGKSEGYRLMDSCPNSHLYVANGGNDSVTVIDTKTDRIVRVVPVGDDPRGVRCNPKYNEVWVTNWGSGTISIIDADLNEVKREVKACTNPWGLDFSNDMNKAVIACWGGRPDIWCSDFIDNQAMSLIENKFNNAFAGFSDENSMMAVNAINSLNENFDSANFLASLRELDSRRAGLGTIEFFDVNSKTHLKTLKVTSTVNGGPWGVKRCKDYVFATDDGTDSVHVIDVNSLKIVGKIKVGELPWDATCDQVRGLLYVANGGANDNNQKRFWRNRKGEASLSVISVADVKNKVNRGYRYMQDDLRIPLGMGKEFEPWSVAVDENSGTVYVVDTYANGGGAVFALQPSFQTKQSNIASISPADYSLMTAQPIRKWGGKFARGIAFVNGKLYVANTGGGEKISTKGSLYAYEGESKGDGSIVVLDPSNNFAMIKEINNVPSEKTGGKGENKIVLNKGWNLISSPVTLDYSRIKEKCNVGSLWAFDGSKYYKSDVIKPMEGYWVHAKENCEVSVSGKEQGLSRNLVKGWNIISSDKSWNEIKGNCRKISSVYEYNSEEGYYVKIKDDDKMNPLRGYWVKVENSCTIAG